MRPVIKVFVLALVLSLVSGVARAHEFFVMPGAAGPYASGQKVPVAVYSTHVFVKGEELEPPALTKVSYEGADIALKADEARLTYDGEVTLKGPGAALILGHRLPILWSETPDGEGEGGRSTHKNAIHSSKYEKFVKLLLPVDGKTGGFDKAVGHKLEIVPVDNPLTAKPGDEILVKVLLDGKPAAFDEIKATYDGFTDIESAWAFAAAPVSHGQARVKISAPGVWSIRAAVVVDEKTAEYDDVNLKAVLTFPVQ